MARGADPTPDERPRLGRPARISRPMIAEAAHELGLDGLTLRAVAEHLDVSIAALYHHVSGKDDLMRLAAEYSATKVPLPQDRGQHWALWLHEWATYVHDSFLAEPQLLTQYLEGAIPAEAIAGNVDTILGLLVRQGFTITAAHDAFGLVTACALGMAVSSIRERQAVKAGRSLAQVDQEVLDHSGPDELPYFRQLHRTRAGAGHEPFPAQIASVLCGIAVQQDLDPASVRAVLAKAARPARQRRRRSGAPG